MQLSRWLSLLALTLAASCTKSDTTECGALVCSGLQVCAPSGDRCLLPSQLDACAGKQAMDGCSFPGTSDGTCDSTGVCIATGCGNGLVEGSLGEVCDDGNRTSFDGCSADCTSAEMCGDGATDLLRGETCDCGTDPAKLPPGCSGINSSEAGATCRPDCKVARCGDGVLDPHELCDDGNVDPGDGCRADCMGRWTQMNSTTLVRIEAIHARTKDDAWAVGDRRILRWNGSTWSSVSLPSTCANCTMTAVYSPAAGEVIVAGSYPAFSTRHVYRYVAGTWTEVAPSGIDWSLLAGHGADMVLGGLDQYGGNHACHWNGTAFVDDGQVTGANGYLMSVTVQSDGAAYATNQYQLVFRRAKNATAWQTVNTTGTYLATSGTDLFVLPDVGDGVYGSSVASATSTFVPLPGSFELRNRNSVAASPEAMLQVGTNGSIQICEVTGGPPRCYASLSPTSVDLFSVSVVDKDHAFIAGDSGTILY